MNAKTIKTNRGCIKVISTLDKTDANLNMIDKDGYHYWFTHNDTTNNTSYDFFDKTDGYTHQTIALIENRASYTSIKLVKDNERRNHFFLYATDFNGDNDIIFEGTMDDLLQFNEDNCIANDGEHYYQVTRKDMKNYRILKEECYETPNFNYVENKVVVGRYDTFEDAWYSLDGMRGKQVKSLEQYCPHSIQEDNFTGRDKEWSCWDDGHYVYSHIKLSIIKN